MVVDGTEGETTLPCWRTLLAMQRVSAGVAKALLLCVVTVNSMRGESAAVASLRACETCTEATASSEEHQHGQACESGPMSGALLASGLQVEVVEVSRWAPEMNRRA